MFQFSDFDELENGPVPAAWSSQSVGGSLTDTRGSTAAVSMSEGEWQVQGPQTWKIS